jgi:hypothetical protein
VRVFPLAVVLRFFQSQGSTSAKLLEPPLTDNLLDFSLGFQLQSWLLRLNNFLVTCFPSLKVLVQSLPRNHLEEVQLNHLRKS